MENASTSRSINNSLEQIVERICELKDKIFEIIHSEKKRIKTNKQKSLVELWDTLTRNNILVMKAQK